MTEVRPSSGLLKGGGKGALCLNATGLALPSFVRPENGESVKVRLGGGLIRSLYRASAKGFLETSPSPQHSPLTLLVSCILQIHGRGRKRMSGGREGYPHPIPWGTLVDKANTIPSFQWKIYLASVGTKCCFR